MSLSTELLYAMTRNHNAFSRNNLHQNFTTDPFSALSHTNAGHCSFRSKNSISVHPATGKKATQGNVTVVHKQSRRRITKKGKKNNVKADGWKVTVKSIPSKKVTGHACDHLAARGVRLHKAALRSARLNKQTK